MVASRLSRYDLGTLTSLDLAVVIMNAHVPPDFNTFCYASAQIHPYPLFEPCLNLMAFISISRFVMLYTSYLHRSRFCRVYVNINLSNMKDTLSQCIAFISVDNWSREQHENPLILSRTERSDIVRSKIPLPCSP